MLVRVAALALAVVALAAPATAARADGTDDDESRVRVACLGGTAELRVRVADNDDDAGAPRLELELRVDAARSVRAWRIVLLHERRLIFEGMRRPAGGGYSLRLRRLVPNWPGRETISARLTAPSGRTCRLAATI